MFNSEVINKVVEDYQSQTFFGIKCIFGEDRHLTSGLIENECAVLFDCEAFAHTETPLKWHDLMMQQARWYKGFYRETLVFVPKVFSYSFWSVLVLAYSFFIPFLAFITIFTVLLRLDALIFFMIYVFIASILMTLRGLIRNCKLRFIHALAHPLFFFLVLLPLKAMALVNCLCSDSKSKSDRWKTILPVYLWVFIGTGVLIGFGFVYNIVADG